MPKINWVMAPCWAIGLFPLHSPTFMARTDHETKRVGVQEASEEVCTGVNWIAILRGNVYENGTSHRVSPPIQSRWRFCIV